MENVKELLACREKVVFANGVHAAARQEHANRRAPGPEAGRVEVELRIPDGRVAGAEKWRNDVINLFSRGYKEEIEGTGLITALTNFRNQG